MLKPILVRVLAGLCLGLHLQLSAAATIFVGPYIPSTAPFVVLVQVTGADHLDSFMFDLSFNPNDFMINTACDAFSGDPYCDFATGPVTLGTFYTDTALFPLFVPGFILTEPGGNQTGQLVAVNGAWQDLEPSPSGDGILAFVEFVAVAGGSPNSPITVVGGPTFSAVPEPASVALLALGLVAISTQRRRIARRSRPGVRDA